MRRIVLFGLLGWALVAAQRADAAPYRGETFTLRQPDGTSVQVRIWGDEFYQHVESLDGDTLTYDKTGWIQFAEPSSDGESLVATGIAYTGSIDEGLQDPDPRVRLRHQRVATELERRGIVRRFKESQRVRQEIHRKNMESVGLSAAPGTGTQAAAVLAASPLSGTVIGLCLLVDFADDVATISRDELDNFWNLQSGYAGFGNHGSIREYYLDISGSLLDLQHYVRGYYRALHNKTYYTDPAIPYGQRAAELLQEALNWLNNQGFNFATLSTRDGYVISCYMMYAGDVQNNWAEGLWPHAGGTSWSADGVTVGGYACGNVGSSPIIGLEVHETGHSVCGWPDLYDYGGDSAGAGGFGMAGSWDPNPDVATSFFRAQKGWMNVIEINGVPGGTTYNLAANLSFTCLRYSKPGVSTEYFMVENFVQDAAGRRPYPPDQGLLIWHVDENGSNSNQQMTPSSHYYGAVEQADGLFELEYNLSGGGDGDLYHTGGVIRLDGETLPNAKWWDGTSSGFVVSNVGPIGLTTSVTVGEPVPTSGLTAEYFDNMDFTGTKKIWTDRTVNFDWGGGGPGGGIGADTFSVRWSGQVQPAYTQTYTFYTTTDDGVRLWVNEALVIDQWIDQGPTEWSGTISLTAGQWYALKMEYYENGGGAVAKLSWSSASQAKEIIPQSRLRPLSGGTGMNVTYFDNMDLTGPKITRVDSTLDFDWGTGSPDAAIGADSFSARWQGYVQPWYSETYTFYTNTDDGVRLWVNGTLLVDKWIDQSPTEWSGTIALTAGQKYQVMMEYYENGGGAVAKLSWSSASQAKEIIPQSQLYPATTLPSPWIGLDIGSPGVAGTNAYTTGVFTVEGGGTDIAGTSDKFRYVYQSASGSCEIRARVTAQENTNSTARAGVMIRDTLAAGARHAFMEITPSGFYFQRRTSTNGSTSSTSGGSLNAGVNNWVRVTRSGNTFKAYKSANGTSWTQVWSGTITMGTNIYIGLAVTSRDNATLSTAVFDNAAATP